MTFAVTRYKGPCVGCTFCAYLTPAQGKLPPAPLAKWLVTTRAGLRELCDAHRQVVEAAEKRNRMHERISPTPHRLPSMSKKSESRVGRRMQDVVAFVSANPGALMISAARHVGPHGSLKFGYRTVHRAVAAGLVQALPGMRRGTWRLFRVERDTMVTGCSGASRK